MNVRPLKPFRPGQGSGASAIINGEKVDVHENHVGPSLIALLDEIAKLSDRLEVLERAK